MLPIRRGSGPRDANADKRPNTRESQLHTQLNKKPARSSPSTVLKGDTDVHAVSNSDDDDFDIAAAAKRLQVSERFIRRRIADGSLKAHRLKGSRLIRIAAADLQAMKQMVEPQPDAHMQALLDAAPEFTAEQRAKLAELLAPVRRTAITGSGDRGA